MALEDELINRVTWKIPNALALVGSRAGDERNGMTTSWITQLSMEPILIGVGVDNNAVTHRLIRDGGTFTINLWDSEDTRVFVKFSKPALNEPGALNGRPIRDGITGAPIFAVASGTVAIAEQMYYEGKFTMIDHGQGVMSIYMHPSELNVQAGQTVAAGDRIGLAGATGAVTGAHLHIAMYVRRVPVDPLAFLVLPVRN